MQRERLVGGILRLRVARYAFSSSGPGIKKVKIVVSNLYMNTLEHLVSYSSSFKLLCAALRCALSASGLNRS